MWNDEESQKKQLKGLWHSDDSNVSFSCELLCKENTPMWGNWDRKTKLMIDKLSRQELKNDRGKILWEWSGVVNLRDDIMRGACGWYDVSDQMWKVSKFSESFCLIL